MKSKTAKLRNFIFSKWFSIVFKSTFFTFLIIFAEKFFFDKQVSYLRSFGQILLFSTILIAGFAAVYQDKENNKWCDTKFMREYYALIASIVVTVGTLLTVQ